MLLDAHLVAYGVLAVLAVVVATRYRMHRPVAAYIGWMFAAENVRFGLMHAYQGAPRPFHGLARVAFHLDEGVALSWYAFFIAGCLIVFVGRGARWAFVAWALLWSACLYYPRVSGQVLVEIYHLTAIASMIASWACIAYGVFFRRDLAPGLPHLILIFYASTDVATYLFSLLEGFVKNWPIIRIANMLLLVACIATHIAWLARHRRLRTT